MQEAARRFVRKILVIHLVLLLALVGIVVVAARELYRGAREQALAQAQQRQETIARQTARGIESFYGSISANLELLERGEEEPPTDTRPMAERLRAPLRLPAQVAENKPLPINPMLAGLIWRQLQTRLSHLFVVDHRQGNVVMSFPRGEGAFVNDLASRYKEWLRGLKEPAISEFLPLAGGGGHMIAVPGVGNRTLVAVVPLQAVRAQFFDPLNREGAVAAALLDEDGRVMVALNDQLVGSSALEQVQDPQVRTALQRAVAATQGGSGVVRQPTQVGGMDLPARVVAGEPVGRLPGRRWAVLISAPLAEVDALVNKVFTQALFWSLFVSISMTGILVSTAATLIRSRLKLERARREILTREMAQARAIQLAWLPDQQDRPPGLDVAAVNLPASHVSGDFYNWFSLPDGRIAVTIGDVTGHGMSAAFLMATAQLLVRTTMTRVGDVGRCLEEVNRQLCTQAFHGQFVTMLLLVLDPAGQTIELAAAGHPAPLLLHNGVCRPLEIEPQLMLGVEHAERYVTQGFVLPPRSSLLLYTDGVVEAEAPAGGQFSAARLLEALQKPFGSAQEMISAVIGEVQAHCGEGELRDDLTLVAIATRGA